MLLKKVLLISCLLTFLVPDPALSYMVDQHEVKDGESFNLEGNDKRQHQASVSRVDLQGTSDDRVLAKTAQKLGSSLVGVPLCYRDRTQTAEIRSQQSPQKINDKYFINTIFSQRQ